MTATTEAAIGDDELLISRNFDAPPALVFRLWESCEHRMRWWGPKDFTCTHMEQDFRPGGDWRACISAKAYGDSWMHGRFIAIERNRRIEFSFAWEDGRGRQDAWTTVTVTFEEASGRTLQRFHQRPFETVAERDSHVAGWSECLDREADYLQSQTKDLTS